MKITTAKTVGSLALGAALMLPSLTFAADASGAASVRINQDGIVRVLDAQVTSISGNIISAVTNLKNTVLSWAVTTNASTTIRTGATTTLAGVQVGDKIDIEGTLSSLGSTLGLTATAVSDKTSLGSSTASTGIKFRTGTVQSVNTANGTFVLKSEDNTFTVATNASTTWMSGGTSTLATLALNSKVAVLGTLSADKSTITATRIMQFLPKSGKHADNEENNSNDGKEHGDHKSGFGFFHGLKLGLRSHFGF